MDDAKRRKLGERLQAAVRSQNDLLVPDVLDGGTMRAALEWAREVTGRPALFVGVVLGQWRALDGDQDTPGVSDVISDAYPTEAEAHVGLAEWAADNRK